MDGRNDCVITNVLEAMAHVMGQENQALLNPPTFKGRYDLKGDKQEGDQVLELKQGNMTVTDYAEKSKELFRFYPHYNIVGAKGSKCIKFESGLSLMIKKFIKYQEIRQLFILVNKCRIYDEDNYARSAHYKSFSEKKSGSQNRGKP
ncbi:uncharacterized protein LOC127078595 [Lathyrus oleraceus]|uniref:uncharacterized protein LOC127078595 n=1 Tax=Pisum sativum TaxID=3888 RepID=UPI0021CE486C|nr:uncharacterized protein LOC127078595 [Pisum sativum]